MEYDPNINKKIKNYVLTEKLGKGQFGNVYKCVNDKTKEIYAIKMIKKSKIVHSDYLMNLLKNEVTIMNMIKSENVVRIYEFLESPNNYYLILDYCEDGDLSDFIKNKKIDFWNESEAIIFLKQIANGFISLREHNIIHRDFKLQNIFVKKGILKIGDFGFAKINEGVCETQLGTPITMAPEVMNNEHYTDKADLWSVGVVFYMMLFGVYPFNGYDSKSILKDIQRNYNKVKFHNNIQIISDEARDLIEKIFQIDCSKRLDWKEFFNHELFKKVDDSKVKEDIKYNLKKYMQKLALNKEQKNKINKQFDENVRKEKFNNDLYNINDIKLKHLKPDNIEVDLKTETNTNFNDSNNTNNNFTNKKNNYFKKDNNPNSFKNLEQFDDTNKSNSLKEIGGSNNLVKNLNISKKLVYVDNYNRYIHHYNKIQYFIILIKNIETLLFYCSSEDYIRKVVLCLNKNLIRKSIVYTNLFTKKIKNKLNFLNLYYFNEFSKSQYYNELVNQFLTLQNNLIKLENNFEIYFKEIRYSNEIHSMVIEINQNSISIQKLDFFSTKYYKEFLKNQHLFRDYNKDQSLKHLVDNLINMIKFGIESEKYWKYFKDDNIFDWSKFYDSFN